MDKGNYFYTLFLRALVSLYSDDKYQELEGFTFSEYVQAKEWLAKVYVNSERFKEIERLENVKKCNDTSV